MSFETLFGVGIFDPFAWGKIALAVLVGISLRIGYFRLMLERRLTQHRSPTEVRREAKAVAVVVAGMIPCLLGAADVGWFAIALLIALVFAVTGRAAVETWLIGIAVLVLVIIALVLGMTYSGSLKRAFRPPPAAAAPAPVPTAVPSAPTTPSGAPQ